MNVEEIKKQINDNAVDGEIKFFIRCADCPAETHFTGGTEPHNGDPETGYNPAMELVDNFCEFHKGHDVSIAIEG